MNTLPQADTKESRSVRVREDVWEAARKVAFDERTSITSVLDRALRAYLKLPPCEIEDAA